MLVMAPVVLIINGYTKGDWWEAALFALSVAVGSIPGNAADDVVLHPRRARAVKLETESYLVKHLMRFRTSARWIFLCTDKTGT